MQRHLSTGATVIAALLAADRPSAGTAGAADPQDRPPGPDARSLLSELGWGAHRSVAHQARTRGRVPRATATG